MLRKQPGWTPSRIATLAALVLAAGYWFTPAAQVVLAAWMTISPDFSTLTGGTVDQSLSHTFTATGGVEPYTWSASGSIPGLSFDAATATLSGTPTTVGHFTYTISVEDTNGSNEGEISTSTFLVRANTTTTLSLASDGPGGEIMVGFPVWATVNVSETALGIPEPTGQVVVSASGASCTITLVNHQGTCPLFFTTSGSRTITASYQGDTYFNSSSASPTPSPTTVTALSVSPSLTSGRYHTCYQDSTGRVECWGVVKYIPNDGVVGNLQPIQTAPVRMVSAGGYHVCALQTNGTIACWGDNPAVTGAIPTGKFIQISSGLNHVCAVDTSYHVQCWGEMEPALANEPTVEVKAVASGWTHACAIRRDNDRAICWGNPDTEPTYSTFRSLSAGKTHTCGILTGGGLRCWGTLAGTPPSGTNFVEVGSGTDYSCARTSDGQLRCWGGSALAVDTSSSHSSLGVGVLHACALRSTGNYLACWGDNAYSQAPRLTLTPETISSSIPQNRSYSQVFESAGGATPYTLSLASGTIPPGLSLSGVTISGTPSTVGSYTPNLRLTESFANSSLPLELAPISRAYPMNVQPSWSTTAISSTTPASATVGTPVTVSVAVSKSGSSTPALGGSVEVTTDDAGVSCQGEVQTDGTAQCTLYFGTAGTRSITAQYLGDSFYTGSTSGVTSYVASPIVITPDVSAGDQFNCTINGSGSPVCWGKNDSGQSTVVLGTYSQISAGGSTTCARTAGSRLACWGSNAYNMASPPTFSGFSNVSVGVNHACARNGNGSIYCWGKSDYTAVPNLPYGYTWSAVSVGDFHSCGLTYGGGRCWGSSANNRSAIPGELQALGALKVISAGGVFGCAIKADDTLACWGGDGIVDSIKTPPAGSFVALDAGRFHACALRSDGAVVCWGSNTSGQIGPAASGYGSFSAVSAGADHTCALRAADQTLECWGANAEGQAPQLALAPVTLPNLDANIAWQGQMIASGGRTSGYVYSWPLDDAPSGLSLDSASGVISGTPTQPGNYVFDISVRESAIDPFMRLSQSYAMTVRSPVTVITSFEPASSGMVGVPVQVHVSVTEQPLNSPVMGAAPTGTVTVTVDDGRSCSIALSGGSGSCEIYFLSAGAKTFTVNYPGDGLFLVGKQTLTGGMTIVPFSQPDKVFTGVGQTYVHFADGSLGCVGGGCNSAAFDLVSTAFGTGEGLSCALQTDGQARCDTVGGLVKVPGPFVALTVGRGHACALNSSGFPTCWGEDGAGQATPIVGVYEDISAGEAHTCALNSSGMPVCWGSNSAGQSTTVGGPYVDITAGGEHTCAINAAGWVTCWGNNSAGQTTPPGGPYSTVKAGGAHTCALTPLGRAECWGDNSLGQAASPLGIFTSIDAYEDHTCALRDGPKLTCWGANDTGEAPQISINPLPVNQITALAYWEHEFLPEGGARPFAGSVASGTLPPGLNLTLSPAGIVLYGTPTVPDVYPFTLAWESSDAIPLVREEAYTLTVTGTDLNLAVQSAPPSQAGFGKPFYWDFTVTNQAAIALPSGELILTLPATLEGVTVTGLTGCTQNGLTLTCPFGPLASGASVTARVEGTITAWVGERVAVAGETWPLGDAWPEVEAADNRAEDSVLVLGYYIHLPLILR